MRNDAKEGVVAGSVEPFSEQAIDKIEKSEMKDAGALKFCHCTRKKR